MIHLDTLSLFFFFLIYVLFKALLIHLFWTLCRASVSFYYILFEYLFDLMLIMFSLIYNYIFDVIFNGSWFGLWVNGPLTLEKVFAHLYLRNHGLILS